MLENRTQSNATLPNRSWSSYFTWAAKAFALLGVGSIGTEMVRFLLQDNTETTAESSAASLSLLPQEKENTGDLLSLSTDIAQPIVDTHMTVSLLETAKLVEEKDFDDAMHISSTDASIPVTEESMYFILTPVGAIPGQVINADAIDTYVLSPVNHALHAFSHLALHPAMGFAASYLLNAHIHFIPRTLAGCLGAFSSLHVFHVEAASVSSSKSLTSSQSLTRTVTISLTPSRSLTSSQSSTRTSTISLTSSKSITATTSLTLSPSVTLSITLSPSSSAAPFLIVNPLPDQVIDINTPYALKIDGREVFGSDVQAIFVSGLPSWMSTSYVPLGNYDTPGIATRLIVQNNIAYIADGLGGLQIVNVTVPSNPTLLSTYTTTAPLTRLVINDARAYLGEGITGLQVLSVNNPRTPQLLGSYSIFFNNPLMDIVFNNNKIYAIAGNSLQSLDVSNPGNIFSLAAVPILSTVGNALMVNNQVISIVNTNSMYFYNSNSQITYIPLGSYTTGYGINNVLANDVAVVDSTAYVVSGSGGLQIINVANPINPTLLGSYGSGSMYDYVGVMVIGNTAYVVASGGGLKIINVADPTNPTLLGSYSTGYGVGSVSAVGVTVIGSTVYVAAYGGGLQIINVANPASPTLLGSYTTGYGGTGSVYARGVTVVSNTAYVTADGGGLQIINVANPASPTLLGSYTTGYGGTGNVYARSVTVVGNMAYVAAEGALQIINVVNPASPTLLGSYTTGYGTGNVYAYDVAMVGSMVYVAAYGGGLQIINVTNPASPILLGSDPASYNCGGGGGMSSICARRVTMVGSTAYVAAYGGGLKIGAVAIFPFLSNLPIASNAKDIQIIGNTTYVAEDSLLQLFNIQNPSSPTLLSSAAIPGSAQRLLVTNSLAYVAEGNTGIQIFNVANSFSPNLIGSCTTFNSANDVSVGGSIMYVADGNTGLQVLNLLQMQLRGLPDALNIGARYTITVTAMNSQNQIITDSFQITVAQFPTVFQPITPPQPFWAHNFFTVTIPTVTFSNPDVNSNPLSYNATLSDSSVLPSWINFNPNNLIFSGTTPYVNISTSWVVRLKATNTLGGYVSTTFPLTVNPAFLPTVIGSIPFQYPKVDQPFSYFVPQGMFSDPNGNALLFSANFANSTSLPAWLNFNPISATFSGLPHGGDIGNFTVIVTATDSIAGSVSTQFGMYVTYLPQQNGNIPAQVAGIGVPYQYTLNKNIFSSPGGNVLIYDVRRKDGLLLPPWLNFNSTSFVLSGTPNSTNAGTITLQMSASDAYQGTVSTLFDLLVENFPYVNQIIPNQVAGVNVPLTYTVPASTFADADGNTLSYQAALSNGLNLPNWLNWNPLLRQLTGTASSSDKGIQTIRITATDPFDGFTSTTFNLTIENFPVVQNVIPDQLAGVNVPFLYTLLGNVFIDADGDTLNYQAKLSGGAALPEWLNWNATIHQLQGTPRSNNTGLLNVQITATDPLGGSVSSTFNLRVENFPYVNQVIANQVAGINLPFAFTVPATTFVDADGDALTYQANLASGLNLPNWLNWNPLIRQFTGTPPSSDKGIQTIRVIAIDPFGGFNSTTFNITIENFPSIANPISAQLAGVNVTYLYTIPANTFADADGESLHLTLGSILPAWLNWTVATTQLQGTPRATDIGITNVQIIAMDPLGGFVTDVFTLRVKNFPTVNQFIPNQAAGINQAFYFTIPAATFRDPEGDTLTYQAALSDGSVLPNWLNWNGLLQQLIGTPLASDRGTKTLRITATDPLGGFTSTTFNLTVENLPTVANPIPAQLVGVNNTYIYTIPTNTFADIDNEPLRLSVGSVLPTWLNWNISSAQLRGTPRATDVGVLSVQIIATDPLGGFVTNAFNLHVENFPTVNQVIANQLAGINQAFYFTLPGNTFVDIDGNTLTYQASLASGSVLPNWLNWNALNQQLIGTPLVSDRGTQSIRITATDPFGGSVSTIFNLTVENFPSVQIPIPNQLAGVNVFFSYMIPANTFADLDAEPLSYQIQPTSGHALPEWLNWNGLLKTLQGTPRSNNTGLLGLQVTATDPLGGFATNIFTIRIENFPYVNQAIPNQAAGINQPFDYTVQSSTFIDVDHDTLTYQATLSSGINLPNWLNWNALLQQFTGTPLLSDLGVDNIRITATDPFGGFAQAFFNISVGNLPIVANPISNQLAGVNLPFFYRMPLNTFAEAGDPPFTYQATLFSGDTLPNWLTWNATMRQLQGRPNVNQTGLYNLKITATDTASHSISDAFTLRVENFPQVNRLIPNKIAGINLPLSYTLPTDIFIDVDNEVLIYQATLASGVGLPNWLNWNPATLQLTGTPLASDRGVDNIRITASDPFGGSAATTFNITVENLPVLVKPISDQLAGVNLPFAYTFASDTFFDADDESLSYTLRLLSGSTLPTWLNWTANIMHLQGVPQANDRGILNLQLTATDPLGAFVSDNFNLRVEYFPQFNHPISNQVAGVNLPFIFTLPANTFTNLEGDLLTYDTRLLSGAALPNWMQWDSGTQKLKGTPQISDVGVNTIQVIATDPLGATASGSFQLSVVQLPILNHPITPPAFFKENKPLVFVISPDTFNDPNHLSLNYTATLNDGSSLPTWLSFNQDTLTFSGQPTSSDEGNLALQVIVTNSQGASTTAPFMFHIIPDSAPVVANPISNLVAEVGISFKFVVPDITFNDPNGDALTYSAQLSDGSPLPLWLSFRGNIFSGTPGGDDTNFYQIRVLPISLRASDGTLSTATAFNISVSGVSTGEKVVKIVSPILSVLGTGYGLYRKRALILNTCCKKRYQKLEDTAVVGETYSRQLETPVTQVSRVEARFQRNKFQTCTRFFKCQTNGMPGGALLPDWLGYNEGTNTLYSKGEGPKQTDIGNLIIQVRNTDGVLQEQFTLKVMNAEHALSEMTTPARPAATDDYDHRDRVWNDVPLQQLRRASEDEEAARTTPAIVEDNELQQLAPRS